MDSALASAVAALCDGPSAPPAASLSDDPAFAAVAAAVPPSGGTPLGELIAGMGAVLTHGDGQVRRRATALLAALLERAVARMECFKPQEIGNTT